MLMTKSMRAAFMACLLLAANSFAADLGYDPKADPFEQYHEAIAQAEKQHKLVLVIAGGDWCSWCYALDRFVTRNDDVNVNEFFFSQLPAAKGAPHFWIIAPDRNVLASQSTAAFEKGKRGYDKQGFLQFIDRWKKEAQAKKSSDEPTPALPADRAASTHARL
jgi:hypothetical protein